MVWERVETGRARDRELIALGDEIATLARDVVEWRGTPLEARARVELLQTWLGVVRERLAAELRDAMTAQLERHA